MKNYVAILLLGLAAGLLNQCAERKTDGSSLNTEPRTQNPMAYGGFESQIKWGEHLTLVQGCNDCHTPKKNDPSRSRT